MAYDYRHARKHLIPIDAIDFSFEVTKIVDDKELDENGFVWHQAACQTGESLVFSLTSLLLA